MSLQRYGVNWDNMKPCEVGQWLSHADYMDEKRSMVEAAENNLKGIQSINSILFNDDYDDAYMLELIKDALTEHQPLLAAAFIVEHFKGEK